MRYALWSRGRLLGYTELDLGCIQDHVRMGFIEPTQEGTRLLPDATGVPAAAYALARAAKRAAHERDVSLTELADFRAACDRREALELELRDEADAMFPCEWIRVNDIDEQLLTDDDLDSDYDFDLTDDDELDRELEAAIDHDAELFDLDLDGDDHDRPWSWKPSDDRWETTRYHLMVYLGRPEMRQAT